MPAQWDTVVLSGHTCVVVSDPTLDPDRVFVAAFTTFEPYKDDACLLNRGDHPAIKHLTCVSYDFFPDFFTSASLDALEHGQPVPHLAEKILAGAQETRRIRQEAWILLDKQSLFEST